MADIFWTYLYNFLAIIKLIICIMLIKLIKKLAIINNRQNTDTSFWIQKLLLKKKLKSLKYQYLNLV